MRVPICEQVRKTLTLLKEVCFTRIFCRKAGYLLLKGRILLLLGLKAAVKARLFATAVLHALH